MGQPNARSIALSVLDSVRSKNMLATAALRAELNSRDPEPKIAATANALALGVLRNRTLLDHFLAAAAQRGLPAKDRRLLDILRIGAYELLFVQRSRAYATVSSIVELAKAVKGKRVAGFVNAMLRKLAALDPESVRTEVAKLPPAVRLSYPEWVMEEARSAFGDAADTELESMNQPSDIAVRVNTAAISAENLEQELSGLGMRPRRVPFLPHALVFSPDEPPYRTVPFVRGLFWPQDVSSQLVAGLAVPGEGRALLDGCAGFGTKTLAMALDAGPQAQIFAADVNEARIETLRERCQSAGLDNVRTDVVNLANSSLEEEAFDCVLVDAPCSGLGTIRRHPELKWRRTREDVATNARLQSSLLAGAAPLVKQGGRLIYAVCTFTPAEGPLVVKEFLATNPQFARVKFALPDEALRTAEGDLLVPPSLFGADCHYTCVMVRS